MDVAHYCGQAASKAPTTRQHTTGGEAGTSQTRAEQADALASPAANVERMKDSVKHNIHCERPFGVYDHKTKAIPGAKQHTKHKP